MWYIGHCPRMMCSDCIYIGGQEYKKVAICFWVLSQEKIGNLAGILPEIWIFVVFVDLFRPRGRFKTSALVKSPGHANSQPWSPPMDPEL